MKKIAFLFTLITGFLFSSCSNDDIPVANSTVIRVNPSTIMSPFSYQINPGDLDGVDGSQNVRIRLYIYNENGILYKSEQQEIQNYLTSATFNLDLENEKEYTVIAISDVVDSDEGNVTEYWGVSDEENLANLRVTYAGSDSNYGDQEILGISSATVVSGNDITIDLQAAGALVCSSITNIHAYSNIDYILAWGSRGNGYFDFHGNGSLSFNPNLEALPDFIDIDVPNTSYSGMYSYKFLMPQTNYEITLRFFDEDGNVLGTAIKQNLTLSKGCEYLFFVELDPNDNGDGTFFSSFIEVTGQQNRSALTKGGDHLNNTDNIGIECKSVNTSKESKSYKVKDLL